MLAFFGGLVIGAILGVVGFAGFIAYYWHK